MKKEHSGADAAAVESAGSIAPDVAPHVAPTPGPWRVRTEIGTFGDVVDANDDPIAMAQLRNEDAGQFVAFGGQPQRQANAHLIAAAPELMEALKRLVADYAWSDSEHVKNGGYAMEHPITAARAAIAKAEGR